MEKEIQHIHMLGICGTGMGSLAGLLKAKGYRVTGTDQAIYPPMSTQLQNLGIKPNLGFDGKNLDPRPDLVVIGNVISKENPEAKAVLEKQIPYLSMPQALAKFLLEGKDSIVVAGTHGKTTTSNIIAWLLEDQELHPSFMIGGVGLNFGTSYRSAEGDYFVIEGDEYDTAFFDKGSKFLHYGPKYAIISSIEFDHADIFDSLDQIKNSFAKFIKLLPQDGICVVNGDDDNVMDILHNAHCNIVTYGFGDQAKYCINVENIDQSGTRFSITHAEKVQKFTTPLAGKHNVLNTVSALVLLFELGFDPESLQKSLVLFKGVKRRQEVRGVINSVTVIDDFAHHPTAIKETTSALRKKYRDNRLWVIFEPRSNTTRRKIFEKELATSFEGADKVIIANVFHPDAILKNERLDPKRVVENINSNGGDSYFIDGSDHIVEFVVSNIQPNDVVLIMSNGAFGGIHEKLLTGLKKRKHKD